MKGLTVILAFAVVVSLSINVLFWFSMHSSALAFKRNQECAAYKKDIEQVFAKSNDSINGFKYLDKIFYSPKRNSCLYTYHTMLGTFGDRAVLVDVLTNEELFSIDTTPGSTYAANKITFEQEVAKYESIRLK